MELDECVETRNFSQPTAELEYASPVHVDGSRHYLGADDILLRLTALVSLHAFALVGQEYELFQAGTLAYQVRLIQYDIVQLSSSTTS
ncbi:hypothetical protein PI125_g5027 [Phytophthora idaei]|nr:hypothetical protein PI125_g5027 [Phytophthora idaei]KAG3164666.1 hypothetical protein PI126_g5017 [Phytophthora idaei]